MAPMFFTLRPHLSSLRQGDNEMRNPLGNGKGSLGDRNGLVNLLRISIMSEKKDWGTSGTYL
jgi:hypothetical protein